MYCISLPISANHPYYSWTNRIAWFITVSQNKNYMQSVHLVCVDKIISLFTMTNGFLRFIFFLIFGYCVWNKWIKDSSLFKGSFTGWKQLSKSMYLSKSHIQTVKSINATTQRVMNSERNQWKEVFLRIVAVTKMLSKNCVAFYGTLDITTKTFLEYFSCYRSLDPRACL